MSDINFSIDMTTLAEGALALDSFLDILKAEKDPFTTEEIMRWLLEAPGSVTTVEMHLVMMALVCATAMQRLL